MKTNPNDSSFPWVDSVDGYTVNHGGLTKREYFAAMAMQGLIAADKQIEYGDHGFKREMNFSEISQAAIIHADFLIRELTNNPK